MRRRRIAEPHLWAPTPPAEPRLLTPGQLDYPAGLIGQQQHPSARSRGTNTGRALGSWLRWERAALGSLIEEQLMPAVSESQHSAGERHLSLVWVTHREYFGQSTRSVPSLLLTDELRADTRAQYLPEAHVIKVRPSALSRHVLVHECCHAWTTLDHGAAFAAGMLYLMQREFGCDRAALLAKAHSMGLQITR
jgi:hypothetical protein